MRVGGVVVAVVGLVLGLVACGGGSSTTTSTSVQTVTTGSGSKGAPTKAEFIKQGDAICQQFQAELASVNDELQNAPTTSTEDLHHIADLLHGSVPKAQDELAQLRQLQVPQGDDAIINRMLSADEASNSLLNDLADAYDSVDVQRIRELTPEIQTQTQEAKGIAQGYGFKACGSGSGGDQTSTQNYSYSDVAKAADLVHHHYSTPGLKDSPDVFQTRDGCYALVLLGESTINTYVSAGDTVATNPSGTVGIKTDPQCKNELTSALQKLP